MKIVSVREAKAHLSELLDQSQGEGVIITHHGRPKSVIVGAERYTMDEVVLMLDERFQRLLAASRKGPTKTLEEVQREFAEEHAAKKKAKRTTKRTRKAG